jgi:hypothetical protein
VTGGRAGVTEIFHSLDEDDYLRGRIPGSSFVETQPVDEVYIIYIIRKIMKKSGRRTDAIELQLCGAGPPPSPGLKRIILH